MKKPKPHTYIADSDRARPKLQVRLDTYCAEGWPHCKRGRLMVNVNDALRYLSRYDIAAQDRTTLGHLRTWLTEAIEQHADWLSMVTGCGADDIETEIAAELETLRDGLVQVDREIGT